MDKVIYPFQIPIYQSSINKTLFNSLKKELKKYINNNFDKFKTSWNCPTLSTINLLPKDNFYNKEIFDEILKCSKEYFNIWNLDSSKEIRLKDLWVNISKPTHYQEEHNHGDCLFSGTVYINVNEKSGNFIFLTPLSSESILMNYPKILPMGYQILPKNGMIVLFPSWLIHKVAPNVSTQDRISISFNVIYK